MTRSTSATLPRWTALAAAAALAATLAACQKKDEHATVGQQVDSAIAKAEDVARDAQAKAESLAAEARQAGQEMKEAAQQAMADAKTAAAQTGAEIREGAENVKAEVDAAASQVGQAANDTAITASIKADLVKDPDLSALQIDVDTREGVVTLHGSAPSLTAKERAETIARAVSGVKSVDNKLTVSGS